MIQMFPAKRVEAHAPDHTVPPVHEQAVWIDLFKASEEDRLLVESTTGLSIPTIDDLVEIESSSRLYREADTLYLSAPIVRPAGDGTPEVTPLGFVLTRDRLVTIRFTDLPSFTAVATHLRSAPPSPSQTAAGAGPTIFVQLMEGVVDRLADVLERAATGLDTISHQIFRADADARSKPAASDKALRKTLVEVGRIGDLLGKMRDTLLAVSRMPPFVLANVPSWLDDDLRVRLGVARDDVHSLVEYHDHLQNKVQFLLDATLGFINIEQNNIVKVLTVVSVVGVPPTLVAGIYGMNFKYMPELEWTYGYPYGLALILLSAILPLLFFKVRGWL